MENTTNLTNTKARKITHTLYIIAALSTIATFLLPIPLSFKIPLALGLIVAQMHTGASLIYFSSLKKFTTKLKIAYTIVCAGSMFIALGTIQLLVVNALGWQWVPWVAYGGTELPILIGLFLGYLGYSRFATLLDIKFAKWSPILVLPLCLLVFAIMPSVPHVPKIYPELGLDISMSMSTMQLLVLLLGIILIAIMKRRAGPLYTPALAWTLLAFVFGVLAVGQQLFQYLFLPDDHWYVAYRLYTISIGISGILSLRAALAFSAIPSASELSVYQGALTFFGKQKQISKQDELSVIDIVTFVSSLASDARAIDPLLDRVRVITAGLGPAKELTAFHQKSLVEVYCQLEDYLVTKEPVRAYDRKELRMLIKGRFAGHLDQTAFWQEVAESRPYEG